MKAPRDAVQCERALGSLSLANLAMLQTITKKTNACRQRTSRLLTIPVVFYAPVRCAPAHRPAQRRQRTVFWQCSGHDRQGYSFKISIRRLTADNRDDADQKNG